MIFFIRSSWELAQAGVHIQRLSTGQQNDDNHRKSNDATFCLPGTTFSFICLVKREHILYLKISKRGVQIISILIILKPLFCPKFFFVGKNANLFMFFVFFCVLKEPKCIFLRLLRCFCHLISWRFNKTDLKVSLNSFPKPRDFLYSPGTGNTGVGHQESVP